MKKTIEPKKPARPKSILYIEKKDALARSTAGLRDQAELRQMYLGNGSELQAFAREIEAIEKEFLAKQSPDDVQHIEYLLKLSARLERTGRYKIRTANNMDQWLRGLTFLAGHYVMEITNGHSLAHGMYDPYAHNRPHLDSNQFDWQMAMHPQKWKFDHIENHHPFTNFIGWDHDLVFFLYRASGKQDWKPHHLFQLPLMLSKATWLQSFLAVYMTASESKGKQIPLSETDFSSAQQRIWAHFKRNYIDESLKDLGRAGQILLGTALGNIVANLHIFFMVAVEHLSEDVLYFEPRSGESPGQYYLRQILGTTNFETNERHERLFTGGVSNHTEHHLMPALAVNHLPQVQQKIAKVCQKYGVPYNRKAWPEAIKSTLATVLKYSLPVGEGEDWAELWRRPDKMFKRILAGLRRPLYLGDRRNFDSARARVHTVEQLNGAVRLEIRVPDAIGDDNWPAGAYITIGLPDHPELVRCYSLLKPGRLSDRFEIAVRTLPNGAMSTKLAQLKPGDQVTILGEPQVNFTLAGYRRPKLFIAGGVGITPILSMLEDWASQPGKRAPVRLLYFNVHESRVLFAQRIERLTAAGLDYHSIITGPAAVDGVPVQNSLDVDTLAAHLMELGQPEVYVCGPSTLQKAVEGYLTSLDFPMADYFTETFQSPSQDRVAADLENGPMVTGIRHKVLLTKSNISFLVDEGQPLLPIIQEHIEQRSGCQMGMCKACTVFMAAGSVEMAGQMTSRGWITLCTSFARANLELDI